MKAVLSNNESDISFDKDKRKKKKKSFISNFKQNIYLYILVLPGVLFFIIFKYLPMFGIIVAFQDFNVMKGFFQSKFVGLSNFVYFFTSKDALKVTWNTIYLNILFIFFGLFFSILIALVLSEIGSKYFKKATQSIAILPHFISWPLVSMCVFALLSTDVGFVNNILVSLGFIGADQKVSFYSNAPMWPAILVILRIWKGAGFGSIVYLAAITGMDQEIYEAARMDGASRLQIIARITLPQLKSTAILLTIMNIGGIFHGDVGMIYAIVGDNPNLYASTDVIDTYVFRMLRQMNDIGMSSAIGLYQSVVGFIIVFITNFLARKFEPDSAIF